MEVCYKFILFPFLYFFACNVSVNEFGKIVFAT